MDELEKTITHYLEEDPAVGAIILFGSQANGSANQASDVDIAILFRTNKVPNQLDLLELKENLCGELGKEVDLIALNTADPIVSMQILKHGKELLVIDEKGYNDHLVRLFTDYADLKRIRAPMEQAILKRKYYDR